MVITNINSPELARYASLHKDFPKAFDTVREFLKSRPENGRYELDGDRLYCTVQCYQTKQPGEAKFEAHKKYIDIQVMLEGDEIIRFETEDKLSRTSEYSPENDIEFFAMSRQFDSVRLSVGDLAIIFPEEAHAPCITAAAAPTSVCKLVVKVLAD